MESSGTSSSDEEVRLLSAGSELPARATTGVSRVKTWTTRVTIATFFLVVGIEYSVIFPTLWDYLRGKGGEEWMYGLSLAAFSISNLVTGPLYGVVFDMTHQTKLIVLVATLFEIGGNFMYFSATSKYMIVGSRFVVGEQ
jgi:MFS family permease